MRPKSGAPPPNCGSDVVRISVLAIESSVQATSNVPTLSKTTAGATDAPGFVDKLTGRSKLAPPSPDLATRMSVCRLLSVSSHATAKLPRLSVATLGNTDCPGLLETSTATPNVAPWSQDLNTTISPFCP